MFSNQYMGTRLASRSLPRYSSHNSSQEPGPYSRQTIAQKPINARCDEDDDDEVDYSFMNLPVRERRKLFLGGGTPIDAQPGHGTYRSMPYNRNQTFMQPRPYETQSEYGCEYEHHSPTWSRVSHRGASDNFSQRSRSSKTFNLMSVNRCSTNPSNGMIHHSRNNSDIHIMNDNHYSPRASSPRPHNDTYANMNAVRILTVPAPRQRSCPKVIESTPFPAKVHCAPVRVSNRNATPLRVNIYNSDGMTTYVSPKGCNPCGALSPVYPAYPVSRDRTTIIEVPNPRCRREQSAKPIAVYPTKCRTLEARPVCKPAFANPYNRGQSYYDQVGVSDF